MKLAILLVITLTTLSNQALANCKIFKSTGEEAFGLHDLLANVILKEDECPTNVFQLKSTISGDGLQISPSMVANRGRHNPRFGSFSFFEITEGFSKSLQLQIAPGHFYFGHFTAAASGTVELDQAPRRGKLMVELIAWDFTKKVYNFYELIGTSTSAVWFYRGDSKDALLDNKLLHVQPDPNNPTFGNRMRCSGCHVSGGPIMKELGVPHNDWWTSDRPLPLEPNQPSASVSKWLNQLMDAGEFSSAVKDGIELLNASDNFQKFKDSLTLKEQLRPLFCTTEINLVSDVQPLGTSTDIRIPAQYFVNPLLTEGAVLTLDSELYLESLTELNFNFPETNRIDADHAWLAPVKGHADLLAIKKLVENGIVDDEFVSDVLAIDFINPLFSEKRCSLLRLVPEEAGEPWMDAFEMNLETSSLQSAGELLSNITESSKNREFHVSTADRYLAQIAGSLNQKAKVKHLILGLQRSRVSVFNSEISKNPMGQILEPGFRVIFPVQR